MKIFIENLTKKKISLELDQNSKIEEVKVKIHEIEGIDPENQYLTFEGQELDDCNTLNDYSIHDNSTIRMVIRLGYKIFVEISNGKRIRIDSKPITSISRIKEEIEQREGIDHNFQQLFFNGKEIENDKRLLDYDIESNSTLQLIYE